MRTLIGTLGLVGLGTLAQAAAPPVPRPTPEAPKSVTFESPSKKLAITLAVGDNGQLGYSVTFAGKPVIEPSRLGIKIDSVDLGENAKIDGAPVLTAPAPQRYPYRGVHSEAIDHHTGAEVNVTSGRARYRVDVEVFDDAVAFRFFVPGRGNRRVPDAATTFRLPADSIVWYHGLAGGHYEGEWDHLPVQEIKAGEWVAPPTTFKLPGGRGYASITEAALVSYSGMALQASGDRVFREALAHEHPPAGPFVMRYPEADVKRLAIPAVLQGAITTPWRVILVGPDLDALVSSDAIPNLCSPPDPRLFPQGIKTPWLRPGRAVWRYLDGDVPMPKEAPAELGPGASQEERERNRSVRTLYQMKEYSRLAGLLGFEWNVVEGVWRSWTPSELREFVQYSKERGVSVMVWTHCNALRDREERRRLFADLHDAGVGGLKVDFFDHEAKEWIDLYQAILHDGAEYELVFDFHGANKPTGEPRTFPNEMLREAIRGMESSRMPARGLHDTTWPFTRLLAGHADYTPMIFGERRRETSWAHQIASAAILTSPILIYGASPATMLAHPAVEMIKAIPSVWDETIVLPPSEIGDLALYARRSDKAWFVAAMNNELVKDLKVETSFLEKGRSYQLLLVKDRVGVDAPADAVDLERRNFTGGETLAVTVRGGGGFVARLTPAS